MSSSGMEWGIFYALSLKVKEFSESFWVAESLYRVNLVRETLSLLIEKY